MKSQNSTTIREDLFRFPSSRPSATRGVLSQYASTEGLQSYPLRKLNSIDEVIDVLGKIIYQSEINHDPLGYFTVLYQKVTIKVKEGIENNFFDNGPRMEKLDILFAERYLKAYFAYRRNEPLTASWKRAFDMGSVSEPTVLQHLLLGINAHINLDLGIVAAEISKNGNINDLKNDFIKINKILSSLVDEVQDGLCGIWPFWGKLLKRFGQLDNLFIDFMISVARNGAWRFARNMVGKPHEQVRKMIAKKDRMTARKAKIIGNPGVFVRWAIQIMRMLERGTVSDKIRELKLKTCYVPSYEFN